MLIKDLVKLANDLDSSGLKAEADAIDEIINAVKKILSGRNIELVQRKPSDQSNDEEQEPEEEGEQVSLLGYKTQNFDICQSAVSAFKIISDLLKDSVDNELKDKALSAIESADKLFQIEKNVTKSRSATTREVDEALSLYRNIIYNIGALSLGFEKDLLEEFDVLDVSIQKIKDFKNNGDKNE